MTEEEELRAWFEKDAMAAEILKQRTDALRCAVCEKPWQECICPGAYKPVSVGFTEPEFTPRPIRLRTESILGRSAFPLLMQPVTAIADPQVSRVPPRRGGKLPVVAPVFNRKRPRLR